MRMKAKWLALLLAGAMSVTAMTACGGEEGIDYSGLKRAEEKLTDRQILEKAEEAFEALDSYSVHYTTEVSLDVVGEVYAYTIDGEGCYDVAGGRFYESMIETAEDVTVKTSRYFDESVVYVQYGEEQSKAQMTDAYYAMLTEDQMPVINLGDYERYSLIKTDRGYTLTLEGIQEGKDAFGLLGSAASEIEGLTIDLASVEIVARFDSEYRPETFSVALVARLDVNDLSAEDEENTEAGKLPVQYYYSCSYGDYNAAADKVVKPDEQEDCEENGIEELLGELGA